MSKKKSFKSGALSTLTGSTADTAKTPNKTIVEAKVDKGGIKEANATKSPQIEKKQAKMVKEASSFTKRSASRTGKPVTLYLNVVNYEVFKQKAKEEDRTVSNLINEFIAGYIS